MRDRFDFYRGFFSMFHKQIKTIQFGSLRHIYGRLHQHISGDNHSLILSDFLWLYLFKNRINFDFIYVGFSLWGIFNTKTDKSEKDQFQKLDSNSILSGDFGIFSFVFGSLFLQNFSA
jgi:hypothetical protein